jgi:hypothetical protein
MAIGQSGSGLLSASVIRTHPMVAANITESGDLDVVDASPGHRLRELLI